jgi:hypothetical protein
MFLAITTLIAAAVAALYLWGRRLPPTQQLSRDVLINAPMERVWSVMTDYLRQVEWRSDLASVEMAASEPGREAWTERPRHGRAKACRIARKKPGCMLEIERLPHGLSSSRWTASLEKAAQATRLTLCETVLVTNPFARVWLRTGAPGALLESYERDLKQHVEAEWGDASPAAPGALRRPSMRPAGRHPLP